MARNNNKINYPTNVVNPITYATYMQMIASQPDGQVAVSYASNTLFPSIKYGKDEDGKKDDRATAKKDTHTIGVLLSYGLAEYVDEVAEKTVRLTHFGKRFLEVFQKSSEEGSEKMERKEEVDINYNALMLEILLNWKSSVGEKVFYPGALLVQLLMDERLDYKFNAYEWCFICENLEFIKTENYDKLVSDVLEFRKRGEEIELKKAHDFCNSLANSWTLLTKNEENYYSLRELTIENIKDWKANNRDLVLVEKVEETQSISCFEVKREKAEGRIHPFNFIVYGAPGTGKTYSMVEYALAVIDNVKIDEFRKNNQDRKVNVERYKSFVKSKRIVFTTFHQSYGYEEFIQGLRPDKDSDTMKFKTVNGVFKQIADEALKHGNDERFVIIIDEINRANISKVFGELITLIEEDKRWGEDNEMSATLQSGDSFAVPNNLYIVGTMNSADKSISLIDAALRRRFSFIEQRPDVSLVKDSTLRAVLKEMNLLLADKLESTDLLVGHSYFMKKEVKDLCDIMNNSIIPLLYEYFYDQRKRVRGLLEDVISKTKAPLEIDDDAIGRLRVKMKAEVATDGSEPV